MSGDDSHDAPEVERDLHRQLQDACMELRSGEYEKGWQKYELRHVLHRTEGAAYEPQWRGESLAGKRVLVHREQGVGDEVWFASAFPDLIAAAGQCAITCDPRLAPLFERSFAAAEIRPDLCSGADRRRDADADFHVPAGNLFRYFRHRRDLFPDRASYLRADPERTRHWQRRLAALGPRLKVGISWQGRGGQVQAPWELWTDVLSSAGCCFCNLQFGDAARDLERVPALAAAEVIDFSDLDAYHDLDDLAALMRALDVVISVPNTNVHLAGALGARIWIPFDARWGCFWVLNGVEVPWYSSARVYPKGVAGSWAAVAASIRRDLASLCEPTLGSG